ncbi:DUF2851 domain-containing protein [Flagellimonas aquimarina]|uniref:DUF2851 domain-containing protein n=1 Tax=Flagellimonas aquimarina TaxID=2201895 RepID=A0A316KXA4_9FLAO|nr:DUF2851 family protein [Allomuricauda koreensis]PWL37425.1 DUF2851 domain-containing protein [Allomuricauda koreensis]
MREDLLHFIWRHNKLRGKQLVTSALEQIEIKNSGSLNQFSGPDFFNAIVEINGQTWAGNVEMHLKSSDWYAHHHEKDPKYDNVILHVVWEDDMHVFRKDGTIIPTLRLNDHVSFQLLEKYQSLMEHSNSSFINCEKDFGAIDDFLFQNWMDRLYIDRLEQKSSLIFDLLKKSKNDWEKVLFVMLMKNFGSKVNGEFFLERAKSLNFSIIRKSRNSLEELESLLFGYFGLLEDKDCPDNYFLTLKKEYEYLSKKFELSTTTEKPEFFGLRPSNFPTIRLSQFANLYAKHQNLFSKLMQTDGIEDVYTIFETAASHYWDDHFTFGKVSKKRKKKLSKRFVDLLVINTIVPMKFCYSKHLGKDMNDDLMMLISQVKKEENSVISGFENLGSKTRNALQSQAKIQLYNNYCSKNKCLQCSLGAHLLNRNT